MVKIINAVEDEKPSTLNIEYKNITLEELISELSIDKMHVGAVLINGVPKRLKEKIVDDSVIYILPILGGG